jgi:triosephosphate isomerase (TIM)
MTNKLKYFIGNWKMFGNLQSFAIVNRINKFAHNFNKKPFKSKIILCVPSTLIYFFNKKMKSSYISLGAQNCHHHHEDGPFTGSVSASMLKNSGSRYIILGHSENRSNGESNSLIKKKIKSSLNQNLKVIFCVGESFKEKKLGKTLSVITKQILGSLEKKNNFKNIIIAYEPVWSIGSNKIPTNYEIRKVSLHIKKLCKKRFYSKYTLPVLYGGSVNSKNVKIFSLINDIDGFLIGGASQSSNKFIDIIKNYYK